MTTHRNDRLLTVTTPMALRHPDYQRIFEPASLNRHRIHDIIAFGSARIVLPESQRLKSGRRAASGEEITRSGWSGCPATARTPRSWPG